MGTFTLYDADGKVIQSNTVYNHEGYGDKLHEAGQGKFIFTEENTPLHHDDWHVNKGCLHERRDMPIKLSKSVIKAGGVDTALLTQLPKGCTVTVETSGVRIMCEVVKQTEIEIDIPVPCLYSITIDKWPFKTFRCQIEAVA